MSNGIITRRVAVKFVGAAIASTWLYGCGDDAVSVDMARSDAPDPMMPNAGETMAPQQPQTPPGMPDQVAQWEAGGVLTPVEPGQWAEKIAGHYPIAVQEKDGIRVRVAHPMDADHYISAIYLKDASGQVIRVNELKPGDQPTAFFPGFRPDAVAYAVCNLHQVWKAPIVRTQDLPGPWEAKVNGHTPRIKMVGNEVTVKVPHPMNPDHYIVAIYVTDQDGIVIGKTQLKPGDEASYTMTVEAGVTSVQGWALCDDHDLWSGLSLDRSVAQKIEQWNASEIRTPQEPGPWQEKIVGHYPIANAWENRVIVHTPHAMDPDHYIQACYLQDADGYFVGYASFAPGDWPSASFDVTDTAGEYMAYSVCNLHDVWAAPVVRTEAKPGPWAEKIAVHTPKITSVSGNQVTVSVEHVMSEDHYIVGLYLTDQNGRFIAKKQLNPVDNPEATYTFTVPGGVEKVTPWALCDDHDLWSGKETGVA